MNIEQPNIVLIYMDDQSYKTIGSLNNPEISTPNLDRLVARGTTFTHAFNQGSWVPAVCVASRAMLISGTTLFHARNQLDHVTLLGQLLGEHGYDTFFTGKWHNSMHSLERSYKRIGPWFGGLNTDGYSPGNEAYDRPSKGNTWRPDDRTQGRHWVERDGEIVHSSELWSDAAIGFLDEHAGERGGRPPFFLHIAYHAPHDPRQSPTEFVDMYPREEVEIPPNFVPRHPFDQGDADIRDEMLAPFPRTKDAVRLHRQEYYAIISHADQQIGRVLDAVEALGLADETVVVFSSDHGLAVGEHGLMGKQNQYDHSVRVPLVFAGPGVPAGLLVDNLVYQSSIYPTLCELAEVALPASVEFPSVVPLMSVDAPNLYESVFGGYRDFQRMVRTTTRKLIVYPQQARHQLFDVDTDPWETHDCSADPGREDEIMHLREQLEQWQLALEDSLDVAPAFRNAR